MNNELNPAPQDSDRISFRSILREAIDLYVDAYLDDPELGPAMLQRKFRVSRTQLYALFSDGNGIQGMIREKRLSAAFKDLCTNTDQRVTDVIYRHGFSNERQFHRSFRERFGVAPRKVALASRIIEQLSPSEASAR